MTVHPETRFAIAFLIALALILAVGTVRDLNFWRSADERGEAFSCERALDVAANPALPAVSAVGHHAVERHFRRGLLVAATLLVVAAVLVFALARLRWRVAAYFEAVHLAPLNPQVVSLGAASHRRAPIDQGRFVR